MPSASWLLNLDFAGSMVVPAVPLSPTIRRASTADTDVVRRAGVADGSAIRRASTADTDVVRRVS